MRGVLGFLTLLAAGLLIVAGLLLGGASGQSARGLAGVEGTRLTIDYVSFALGAVAGQMVLMFVRIPWHSLPRAIAELLASWRRNVVLASMVAVCVGVLLFY